MYLFPIIGLIVAIMSLFGWVKNLLWTFNQADIVHVLLGALGVVVAPVGAIHGLYVAFF